MGAGSQPLPAVAGQRDQVLVREWQEHDAENLIAAVDASREHLRPWMEWASEPPRTPAQQLERMREWRERRAAGGDAVYGIFVGGDVAGGCGLHRRIGPGGLEIGYWVHVDHIGRGAASLASRILTDVAFAMPEIDRVEIHHDKANVRSGRVPIKLGYVLAGEAPDEAQAPAEIGIDCTWRMTRERWAALSRQA